MDLEERQQIFMRNAIITHGDRYDYANVRYINSKTKIEIICREHGSFFQVPNNHTSLKQGCPRCEEISKRTRNTRTTQDFIEWSKVLHGDRYDYSQTNYTRGDKPVIIICKEHGQFKIGRAEKHYKLGQGCPGCCIRSVGEERIKSILTENNILFESQKKFTDCVSHVSGYKLAFDFFLPDFNILIEYDGIQHTKKSPLFHPGDKFEQMQQHDAIKTKYAMSNGYVLIRIPFQYLSNIELSTILGK